MFDVETLVNAVQNNRAWSPSGVQCEYIRLNEDWGIKVYSSRDSRDFAFNNQSKAAPYDLGPNVGITFDISDKFCYVTENVETLVDAKLFSSDSTVDDVTDEAYEKYPNLGEMINKLHDALLRKANFGFWDCHLGNLGWKNGKLVCIDFG